MTTKKAQFPTIESEHSPGNRITTNPKSMMRAHAEGVNTIKANRDKPYDQTNWEENHKAYHKVEKFSRKFETNGGVTFKKGDAFCD